MFLKKIFSSNQRYILILLLFFHTVNTYMDRICISAASSEIKHDLSISDQMMGYIFGIFAIGYALFQIPSGWLVDKFGPRKTLTIVVTTWSSFTILTGAAWNTVSLLVIRFLFGIGESGAFPGATRAFYTWIPANERSIAQGIFHSGARVGSALSLFLIPLLILTIGWRYTFFVLGLLGIIWAIIWYRWFRDLPSKHKSVTILENEYISKGIEIQTKETTKDELSFAQIVTSRNMLLAMFQYIASNITFFISFTWMLPYMISKWGTTANYYAWIPLAIGTTAHWISGFLGNFIFSKGFISASRKLPAIVGFCLSIVGLLFTSQFGNSTPLSFVLFFSIAVFGVEMTVSPSWSFCMDIGGKQSGAVSGAMNMLGNFGSAFSAVIFPYFVAHISIPYFAPKTGSADSFFVFAASINLLAVIAWLFMNPQKKIKTLSSQKAKMGLLFFISAIGILLASMLIYNMLKN